MGFGGRKATASDGTVVGSLGADVITMMIGFNDAAQGTPISQYTANLEGTIQNIRATTARRARISAISPIWTDSGVDLTSFRQAVAGIVTGMNDANLHYVDGLTLVPNDPAYFPDGIHPNNAGLAFMAARKPGKYCFGSRAGGGTAARRRVLAHRGATISSAAITVRFLFHLASQPANGFG